jgi:tetratricopeptide (TPR) repeat protein
MKKNTFLLSILLMTELLILTACSSTPHEQISQEKSSAPENTEQTSPKASEQTDTPETVFVKQVKAALEKNDMNGALQSFDTMPSTLKSDTELQILHASLLVSAGRCNEAKTIGDTLQVTDSSNLDILELNMTIATASGDKQTQKALIQKILSVDPYNPAANIRQAEDLVLNKKYKLAGDAYKKVLTKDPENTDALFGYAQMQYYQNNLDDAENNFQKILEKAPQNAFALAYMGKLAAEKENYLRATKYIQSAIASDNTNYDFYVDLGTYQRYQGNYKDAINAWTKAVSLDPSYFLAYTYRGGLYDEMSNFKDALADYLKIIELNPKYYFAYEEIGILQWHAGNWAQSREAFQQALVYAPANPAYLLIVSATYLKEKNMNDGKAYLEKNMKGVDTESLEYQMMRLYHDQGGINAENNVMLKVNNETNTTKRGKMMYYLGLYFEMKGLDKVADEYYAKVTSMKAPQFFEYRLAEWSLMK